MTDSSKGRGNGLTSAGPFQAWITDYSSGHYTEVARAWLAAREQSPAVVWGERADVVEAVGWSLALTKSWDAYGRFRADLRPYPEHADLLGLLDAWHAIHEARYDAGLFGARNLRNDLLHVGTPSRALGYALRVEGVALFRLGRYAEAEALTRNALELFQLADDRLNVSHCATNLGLILNARGEMRTARAALRQSVEALLEAGAADERLALARVNLAVVELHLGQVETARALFEASLRTFETLELRTEQITALNGLGHCARALGRFDLAISHHRTALRLTGPDLLRQVGLCHEFLGQVYFDRGDRTRAETHYRRALEVAASIAPDGDLMLEIDWHYAELLLARGRTEDAREHVERAEQLCAVSQERRELGCVQRARARLLAATGDPAARAAFATAFATLTQTGRVLESVLTLLAQAEFEVASDSAAAAIELLEQARLILLDRLPDSAWLERAETRLVELRHGAALGRECEPRYGIVTHDPDLQSLLADLPAISTTPYPVLLEGESGTGKELLARAVHAASDRQGAWVALNCAALPRDLFESELFGHARGSFSGALADKSGLFEQAAGGTLFLDEIGEMPLELQAKLLRVLDDGQLRRVGDTRQVAVDVKIVAATNRSLEPLVADGRFRLDLYHRLAVHAVQLRPLRERRDDIELLARHFLRREGLEDRVELTPALLAELESRPWPGNARELRNALVRAATQRLGVPATGAPAFATVAPSLRATRSSHERRIIETALADHEGSVIAAARSLRLHVTTLRRKMRALGVQRPS